MPRLTGTATRRLRQWLCRKHQVRSGQYVRFPDERLWQEYGHPPCRAHDELSVGEGMISSESRLRKPHGRFDERRLETEPRRGVKHRHRESRRQQLPPSAYRHRASRRLYPADRHYVQGQVPLRFQAAPGRECTHVPTPRKANLLGGCTRGWGRMRSSPAGQGRVPACWSSVGRTV